MGWLSSAGLMRESETRLIKREVVGAVRCGKEGKGIWWMYWKIATKKPGEPEKWLKRRNRETRL